MWGSVLLQPGTALLLAHLAPLLSQGVTLLWTEITHLMVELTHLLTFFRIHLFPATQAVACLTALLGIKLSPALSVAVKAGAIVGTGVPALADRRNQQFALFGRELLPCRQGRGR